VAEKNRLLLQQTGVQVWWLNSRLSQEAPTAIWTPEEPEVRGTEGLWQKQLPEIKVFNCCWRMFPSAIGMTTCRPEMISGLGTWPMKMERDSVLRGGDLSWIPIDTRRIFKLLPHDCACTSSLRNQMHQAAAHSLRPLRQPSPQCKGGGLKMPLHKCSFFMNTAPSHLLSVLCFPSWSPYPAQTLLLPLQDKAPSHTTHSPLSAPAASGFSASASAESSYLLVSPWALNEATALSMPKKHSTETSIK